MAIFVLSDDVTLGPVAVNSLNYLYISYKYVDEVTINLDQKFSNVTKEINLNSEKFLKIEEMINNNSQSYKEKKMNRNQKEFQSHIDTKFSPQNAYVRDVKTIGRTLYNDEMYIFNHANNQKDFDSILNNASNNIISHKGIIVASSPVPKCFKVPSSL